MDIELARTFVEIVKTRSFVRAAERLNVSQTAVSARIRALEEQLGQSLFIRNKNGASLRRPASSSCAMPRCSCSCGRERATRSPCRKAIGLSSASAAS